MSLNITNGQITIKKEKLSDAYNTLFDKILSGGESDKISEIELLDASEKVADNGLTTISGQSQNKIWGADKTEVVLTCKKETETILQITLQKPIPTFSLIDNLFADLSLEAPFQNLQLSLLTVASNEGLGTIGIMTMEMTGELKLGEDVLIPWKIEHPENIAYTDSTGKKVERPFTLECTFDQEHKPPTLTQLAALFNSSPTSSTDLEDWLPGDVKKRPVSLRDLRLTFDRTDPQKLIEIETVLTIQEGEMWDIFPNSFPGLLAIGDLWIDLNVEHPLDPLYRFPMVSVGGTIQLGEDPNNGNVRIKARWPDYAISGQLVQGQTIEVGTMLSHFKLSGTGDSGLEKMAISQLSFNAEPVPVEGLPKTFSFFLVVDDIWTLKHNDKDLFEINQLLLSLNYSSAESAGLSARFEGKFTIGAEVEAGKTYPIDIGLSAEYSGAEGWQFRGKAATEGRDIPVGKMLSQLIQKFKSSEKDYALPESIDSATLKDLQVAFNTKTKDFSFGFSTAMILKKGAKPEEDKKLAFTLGVDFKKAGENYNKKITGQLLIVSLQFDLVLEQVGSGKSLPPGSQAQDQALPTTPADPSGWVFTGSIQPTDKNMNIGRLVQDIAGAFGVKKPVDVPDFLGNWIVEQISVQFSTANKDFAFDFALANSEAPGLQLKFTLKLTHGEAGAFEAVFKGQAIYISESPKVDIAFDLEIKKKEEKTPARKILTITGDYKVVTPPKLADILAALVQYFDMDVALPAELNIDAAATGFGIEIRKVDQDPVIAQLAGAFNLKIKKTELDLYFAYSNEVALEATFKKPLLLSDKGKPALVFGASLGGVLDLSKLPVVGKIPGMDQLVIDKLGFFYTNAKLADQQQAHFRVPQITGGKNLAPTATGAVLEKSGFNLIAVFGKKGKDPTKPISAFGSMSLPIGGGGAPSANSAAFATAPAKAESPIKWLPLNKVIGPVSLEKVGLNYSKGTATIGFSAGMSLGGFMLDLQELAITFPMPLPKSPAGTTVAFDLKGMAMNIKTAGFELGGAFLKSATATGAPAYYGKVIVQIGTIGLTALGGYAPAQKDIPADGDTPAQKGSPASFFIFANVEIPLGGPPYLFITGFAGGFGINNLLKLPTLENLPGFVLLPGNGAPKQAGSAAETIKAVLPKMQKSFIPSPGQYWVAAGVNFTSFEMIKAFALVTVSFGVDFEIALFGRCAMSFPTGAPTPVAFVEITIMASFSERTGLLAVQGIISPSSYIFGDFCRITGGFAFYIWFNPPQTANGPKAGDFLVTLGGYHPAFKAPDYYPKVPRLGIRFNLGPLQVEGGCYFALTPGMFMAGAYFKATFDIKIVKVWFSIEINFLIGWAPFHYEATAYVRLGCAINLGLLTINISIGADMTIWGPPFGGLALVDLDIISFSIAFGADRLPPPPIGWEDFRSTFLPEDTPPKPASRSIGERSIAKSSQTNILNASVSAGLQNTEVNGFDWILDSDHFVIVIGSSIPVTKPIWGGKKISNDPAEYNADPPPVDHNKWPYLIFKDRPNQMDAERIWNPDMHIKPMGQNHLNSELHIQLSKKDANGNYTIAEKAVSLEPVVLDSPAALWNKSENTAIKANDDAVVKSCLIGFQITPLPRIPNTVKEVPLIQLLYQQGNNYHFKGQPQLIDKNYSVKSKDDGAGKLSVEVSGNHTTTLDNEGYVLQSLTDEWVTNQRNAILQNLQVVGFATYETAHLETFASKTALTDWPEVMLLSDALS